MNISVELIENSEIVENALIEAGYQVTRSNHGVSLYAVNDNGEEIRISDHKRPPIIQGNVPIHEHEEGFIIDGIEVNSDSLIKFGFSRLPENKILHLG